MTPKEYKEMMAYLTRSGIKDQVKFASDMAKPVDKFRVQQIKLFNRFNRNNPNKKADGGRIGFLSGGDVKKIIDIYNAGLEGGYRTSADFIAEQLGKKPGEVSKDIVGRKINELIEDGTLTKQKELKTTKTKGKRKIYKVARPIETRDRINNPDIPKNAKFKMQVPGGKFRGKGSSTTMIYDTTKEKLNKRLKKIEGDVYVKPSKPKEPIPDDKFLVVKEKGPIINSIRKVTYEEVLGKKNQPDTFKPTGKTIIKYKPLVGPDRVTIPGQGADTLEEAQKFVDDYFKANPIIHSGTKELDEKLKTLFDDPRIKKILRTGKPSKEDIDIVKDILGGTDRQAQGKLAQLADAVDPQGQRTVDGISKINSKKAKNIFNFHKTKDIAKELEDIAIGKSVGEGSLASFRRDIQGEIPMKGGLEGYSVDEAKARASAFRLNSKPYAIFGQVIAGDINQGPKRTFDANLSIFEEQVKNAIKNNEDPTEAIKKYNKRAAEAEAEANLYKSRNTKKVYFPRITTDSPDIAIKNKSAYIKYKQYFDKNYAQQGYSFVIPKDLQPLPSLAADLKDKNSSTYKNMIKQIKDVGRKFIKNIDQFDEKKLFQKLRNNPNFNTIRRLMPRLASLEDDFTGPGGFPLTAGLDSSIGVQPVEREENFILRNPGTTAALGTAAAATTPKGRSVLKKIGKGIFDKGIRPLGTRAASIPLAGLTIAENIKKGENVADAVIDPLVGLELSFPGLFKENLAKITTNPTAQRILNLGRFARLTTPVGLGITAAGLGIDAAKAAKKRLDFLDTLTPDQKKELFRKERQEAVKQNLRGNPNAFDEFSAAGGGIAKLAGDRSGPPPEKGPNSQGLPGLLKRGMKI